MQNHHLGRVLDRLARAPVALLLQLGELASNVGRVAVEDRRVALADLARVVEDDDLGREVGRLPRGTVLGVPGHEPAAQLLDRHVLGIFWRRKKKTIEARLVENIAVIDPSNQDCSQSSSKKKQYYPLFTVKDKLQAMQKLRTYDLQSSK